MIPFLNYLTHYAVDIFSPDEYNEMRLVLYQIIIRAVRDQSDTLTLNQTHFTWSRNGELCGSFPLTIKPKPSFQELLEEILYRDNTINHRIKELSRTSDAIIYHIDLVENTLPD